MLKLGKMATAVAAFGLATTPVIAAEGAASKLSLRAATSTEKDSELAGGVVIGVIAAAAFVAGVVIISDNDDDPDSN
jgi:hypothetical protein